ncbi:MAG TPA: hypothetical protein VGP08_17355 [Pyrinomonadaceae bacterium]|nr:hypothetical protein [Pyrinomonadaceae bacterium]
MRHRSNIAFILLAAALFAAPQVAQDLSTLKGALAARVRGEILQAFLGLHSNESAAAATQTQAPRVEAPLVACKGDKPEAQVAQKKGTERTAPAQRNESGTRAQSAMLTDPTEKTNVGLPPEAVAAELASLPRQLLDETKLAMLTPPGNGVEPPPPAVAYRYEAGDARTKAARDKFVELEKHAVFVQARFDLEHGARDARWISRIAEDAARAKGTEGVKGRARVIKLRRQGRTCGGGDNTSCAPVPIASVASPYTATLISDGE